MNGKEWTEARLERLRRLWNEGLTFGQIGKEMGESRSCIAGKCDRLGLDRAQAGDRLDAAEITEIVRLYRTRAYSLCDIAPLFDVHQETVRYALHKCRVKMNPVGGKHLPKRAKRLAQSISVHGAPG